MRALFFISGFILPFPIFVDISRWELIVHRIYDDGYLIKAGMPVPVGLFSSLLIFGIGGVYGLKQSLPSKTWFYLSATLLSITVFSLYALSVLPMPRVVSLVLPITACIPLAFLLVAPSVLLPSLRGYFWGLFAFLILHSLSAVYEMMTHYETKFLLFNSFFGFAIYQALISYSAILSLLVCASFFYVITIRRKNLVYLMLLLTALSSFLVILGQRKAFVMDVSLMIFSLSLYLIRDGLVRGSAATRSFLVVGLFTTIAALTLFYSFDERQENLLQSAFEQRGENYIIFLNKIRSGSTWDFLFGYEAGWGGFSNIFVEMILRLGVIGLAIYFIAAFWALNYLFSISGKANIGESENLYRSSRSSLWLFFFLSVVAANSINMNFQLPYYTLNLIFVILLFVYLHAVFYKPSFPSSNKAP